MSSFSDASISFSDVSSEHSEGIKGLRNLRRPAAGSQQTRVKTTAPSTVRGLPPKTFHATIKSDDDISVSFDESILGDSGDIIVGNTRAGGMGRPPLPASGRINTAGVRPAGIPPKGAQTQRRVTNDSFSISGSLDFSGEHCLVTVYSSNVYLLDFHETRLPYVISFVLCLIL